MAAGRSAAGGSMNERPVGWQEDAWWVNEMVTNVRTLQSWEGPEHVWGTNAAVKARDPNRYRSFSARRQFLRMGGWLCSC